MNNGTRKRTQNGKSRVYCLRKLRMSLKMMYKPRIPRNKKSIKLDARICRNGIELSQERLLGGNGREKITYIRNVLSLNRSINRLSKLAFK